MALAMLSSGLFALLGLAAATPRILDEAPPAWDCEQQPGINCQSRYGPVSPADHAAWKAELDGWVAAGQAFFVSPLPTEAQLSIFPVALGVGVCVRV